MEKKKSFATLKRWLNYVGLCAFPNAPRPRPRRGVSKRDETALIWVIGRDSSQVTAQFAVDGQVPSQALGICQLSKYTSAMLRFPTPATAFGKDRVCLLLRSTPLLPLPVARNIFPCPSRCTSYMSCVSHIPGLCRWGRAHY